MIDADTITQLRTIEGVLPDLLEKLTSLAILLGDIAELGTPALDTSILVADQLQLIKQRLCEIKRIS